jgi:hypothetical protein
MTLFRLKQAAVLDDLPLYPLSRPQAGAGAPVIRGCEGLCRLHPADVGRARTAGAKGVPLSWTLAQRTQLHRARALRAGTSLWPRAGRRRGDRSPRCLG